MTRLHVHMVMKAGTWQKTATGSSETPVMREASPVSVAAAAAHGELKRAQWRLHDRTHLELSTRFKLAASDSHQRYTREAYFFLPASLRVNRETYLQSTMESDFQSYVRLSAPRSTMAELSGRDLNHLETTLATEPRDEQMRHLRLFACRVRRTGLKRSRLIRRAHKTDPADAKRRATRLPREIDAIANRLVAIAPLKSGDNELAAAALWVCEDVTLFLEQLLGRLSERFLGEKHADLRDDLVKSAVRMAMLRRSIGSDAIGGSNLDARMVEHLEFRRNNLKRFTASVLWLQVRSHDPGRWLKHVLYALAAGVAMTFAVIAALWNGPLNGDGRLSALWVGVAIFAYAVKDRLKAALQSAFSGVLRKRYPQRQWLIEYPKSRSSARAHAGRKCGSIDEETEFVASNRIPAAVMKVRRSTRTTMVEEEARPETVLHHKKHLDLIPSAVIAGNPAIESVLEVFRLDLRHWLVHTDDPKNRIVFANPEAGRIEAAKAPRVYNIAVIYGIRGPHSEITWHRTRVVVSRKGIRRIEDIC